MKDNFSTAQTNKSDYNQMWAIFCTSDTFEIQKIPTSYLSLKQRY